MKEQPKSSVTKPLSAVGGTWVASFKNGWKLFENVSLSGCPSTSWTDVRWMIHKDRHRTIALISDELELSIGSIPTIIQDDLKIRKVCSQWEPNFLADNKKEKSSVCFTNILWISSWRSKTQLIGWWLRAPEFIWKEELCWPQLSLIAHQQLEENLELTKRTAMVTTTTLNELLQGLFDILWSYFISWHCLERGVAWIMKQCWT